MEVQLCRAHGIKTSDLLAPASDKLPAEMTVVALAQSLQMSPDQVRAWWEEDLLDLLQLREVEAAAARVRFHR